MRARQARRILHFDAVLDAGVGGLLLLSAWDDLFLALGIPPPEPAIFAELAGVLLLGFAYLLWVAPDYTVLARRVTEVAALSNAVAAALIALWLASRPDGLELLGGLLMGALAVALAGLAWMEARITSM
jgi:hypothetical protein